MSSVLQQAARALQSSERILGHWLLVAAMILVAATLAIPQLDKYPLSLDSIDSYAFAFGLTESAWTPGDLLNALYREIPDQTAPYYLLLHAWGALSGQSLAAGRLISLFAGLLSLAMLYRLSRDFVSPFAALLAVIILLSNALYAFYYAQLRYYTLQVFFSALVIWLYLRLVTRSHAPSRREYLALALACCALVSMHAFGLLMYIVLSLYHLLAVKKDRRWLQVMAAAIGALILALPAIYPMLTDGVARARDMHNPQAVGVFDALAQFGFVMSNGNALVLAISIVGAVIGWRRGSLRGNPFLALFPLLALGILLASGVSGVVSEGQMRYLLVGAPIVVGFAAAGIYALYRLRRWLGLLALLWLVTGMSFMRTADWELLIQGRTWAYTHPPWHLISRWMQQSGEALTTMTFGVPHIALRKYTFTPAHLMIFYFGQYGIEVNKLAPEETAGFVAPDALQQPGYWALYQTTETEPAAIAEIDAVLKDHNYMPCDTMLFPNATVLVTYRWASLQCDTQPKASFATDAGAYQHFGAVHDDARLLFAGAWQPATDAQPDAHNMSFQLLDADWQSHAQIDLPVASLIDMRQPYFDLADLPAGDYRLMAVVYNAHTGERLAWQDNEDWILEMQQLAEIVISTAVDDAP